ncbi:MAG: TRAP transporter large permease subunit [Firmicutes bacterium]|jgi:tripartite ATP-independent transporter DctM subunit|nr:TRAP transporter large permease subunit [Bacillota bacterium]
MTWVLVVFAALLVLGMPVSFAIGISGFIFFVQQPSLPLTMPVQRVLSETQNFALLAIPMFIFAGNLMNETGITKRLVKFATAMTGHMYGGLAQVSVVLSTLMGGVCGSAIADASMEARILGPTMTKRGYSRAYSAAVHGFTALIAIAIPPSIGLVLYGTIGEVSIGRLLAGGIGPGLLMSALLMITVAITSRRRRYLPEREKMTPLSEILPTFANSIWAILFPLLLLVTLRFGLLVPSEAGAAAAVYAMVVGLLVYREMTWEGFKRAISFTIMDIGMVMFLIALSSLISYAMTWEMVPQALSQLLLGISSSPKVIVGIILLFLLLLGMFVDSTVIILLLTAILVPAVKRLGVDLVYFGVLMVITCALGLLTPPVGLAMYSVCSIMECSVGSFVREGWPFFLTIILVLLAIYLFPSIVTFIPNAIFG